MAACAVGFEDGLTQVHQVLATKPNGGASGFARRERYDAPMA
jgi:hypothetical protein